MLRLSRRPFIPRRLASMRSARRLAMLGGGRHAVGAIRSTKTHAVGQQLHTHLARCRMRWNSTPASPRVLQNRRRRFSRHVVTRPATSSMASSPSSSRDAVAVYWAPDAVRRASGADDNRREPYPARPGFPRPRHTTVSRRQTRTRSGQRRRPRSGVIDPRPRTEDEPPGDSADGGSP